MQKSWAIKIQILAASAVFSRNFWARKPFVSLDTRPKGRTRDEREHKENISHAQKNPFVSSVQQSTQRAVGCIERYERVWRTAIIICLSLSSSLHALYSYYPHNFHEVEKNACFRSKQLSPKNLESYLKRFDIKTIINLRGPNPHKRWWQSEKAVAARNGIEFHDVNMCSQHLPHKRELLKLLRLFRRAPRPILMHCLAGADRTGEAAALWMLDQQGKSTRQALSQLTLKYHHIQNKFPAKRFFIKLWQGHRWAYKSYDPFKYPKYYR